MCGRGAKQCAGEGEVAARGLVSRACACQRHMLAPRCTADNLRRSSGLGRHASRNCDCGGTGTRSAAARSRALSCPVGRRSRSWTLALGRQPGKDRRGTARGIGVPRRQAACRKCRRRWALGRRTPSPRSPPADEGQPVSRCRFVSVAASIVATFRHVVTMANVSLHSDVHGQQLTSTFPQGQRRSPAEGHSPQAPAWQTRSHRCRPQPNHCPQTRPHRKSATAHGTEAVSWPHWQVRERDKLHGGQSPAYGGSTTS